MPKLRNILQILQIRSGFWLFAMSCWLNTYTISFMSAMSSASATT